jgi:hypothetical protein
VLLLLLSLPPLLLLLLLARGFSTGPSSTEPCARTGARLLRAAARAYTALVTTSVGPPVNHADPPHVATA